MILFNYSVCNWTSNVLTGNTHYCSFLLLFLPFFLRVSVHPFCLILIFCHHLFIFTPSFSFPLTQTQILLLFLYISSPSPILSFFSFFFYFFFLSSVISLVWGVNSCCWRSSAVGSDWWSFTDIQWLNVRTATELDLKTDSGRSFVEAAENRIFTSTTILMMTLTVLTHQVNTTLDLKSFVFLFSLHLCLWTSSGCLFKDKNEIRAKATSWIDSWRQNQNTLLIPSWEIGFNTVSL